MAIESTLDTITLSNGFSFSYGSVTGGTYIEYNGIRLTNLEKGHVMGRLEVRPELLNPNKTLHGGVYGTLADTVAIFGCVFFYEVASITTINISLSFLKPAKSGTIFAEARMMSQGKSISHWQVDMTDEEGQLLAAAFVSYAIKH